MRKIDNVVCQGFPKGVGGVWNCDVCGKTYTQGEWATTCTGLKKITTDFKSISHPFNYKEEPAHDIVKPTTVKPKTHTKEGTLLWRQLNSVAFNDQVGGNHYKKLAIQPTEYAMANSLDACQANVVKYITRFRDKGGAKDLRKVLHYVEYLLETEYPNE